MILFLEAYLIFINLLALLMFGIDKLLAVHKYRIRIREKTLVILMNYGGFCGAHFAMLVFNHKVKKR